MANRRDRGTACASAALALLRYEDGRAGFADLLILERAREAGCDAVATFDAALVGEPGVIEP